MNYSTTDCTDLMDGDKVSASLHVRISKKGIKYAQVEVPGMGSRWLSYKMLAW